MDALLKREHVVAVMVISKFKRSTGLFVAVMVTMLLVMPIFANPDEWRRDEWPNTDFSKTNISLGQIVSGGPARDGIPSIDKPTFVPLADVRDLGAHEPLIAVEINGEQVGYPCPGCCDLLSFV